MQLSIILPSQNTIPSSAIVCKVVQNSEKFDELLHIYLSETGRLHDIIPKKKIEYNHHVHTMGTTA